MGGFKTVWLTLFLLAVMSCVPQSKQTECATGEAFNAPLRTCVPIVGGAKSHVKIATYTPTTTLVKYVGSTSVNFAVTIDNPYALTYSMEWVRTYNGNTYPLSTSIPLEIDIAPSNLALGTHVISAKVKVSGEVVDTHNFELIITNNPTPMITKSSVTPIDYSVQMWATDPGQNFYFTINNNGASDIASASYSTEWTLYRNGVLLTSFDCDDLTNGASDGFGLNTGSTATHVASCSFDPDNAAINETLGIYTLRARVVRTNPTIMTVDEQQWSITLTHPVLSPITSRAFYNPTNLVNRPTIGDNGTLVAYSGIPYTSSTTYNFNNPHSSTAAINNTYRQAEFCVRVQNLEGTYPGDSLGVRVDFYLDGVTHLYTGYTIDPNNINPDTNMVCLADGGTSVLNNVMFTIAGTSAETHTIVARVTDEFTGIEYSRSNQSGSLAVLDYPIAWKLNVRPTNKGPTISQTSQTAGVSALACGNTVGTNRTCTAVYSDRPFSVTMRMPLLAPSGDDFYNLPADAGNFSIECRVYRNAVLVNTVTAGYSGANGDFTCPITFASYDTTGPIPVQSMVFQIQAQIIDNGSPLSVTGMASAAHTWSFAAGKVFEENTSPEVLSWSTDTPAWENSLINFTARIRDYQHDSFDWKIQYCTSTPCTTWLDLPGVGTAGTLNNNPVDLYHQTLHYYDVQGSFTLAEDFLINLPAAMDCVPGGAVQTGASRLEGESCQVTFRVYVKDKPNNMGPTPLPVPAAPSITSGNFGLDFAASILNYNPRPVFTASLTSPNPAAFSAGPAIGQVIAWAFTGVPMTIVNAPGTTVADASNVNSEGDNDNFRYQWYARNTSAGTWAAIPGASSASLIWTPSLLAVANPVELMVCISDYPAAAVPTPSMTNDVCNHATPWRVLARNNVTQLLDMSAAGATELAMSGTDEGSEVATWTETPRNITNANGTGAVTSTATYTAMIGNDKRIYVKKTITTTTGTVNTISSTHFTVFNALSSGTIYGVKNLSITGVNGDSIYIAYLASSTGDPFGYYPRVRRIRIAGTKSWPNVHPGTLGFDYDGLQYDAGTCGANCSFTNGLGGFSFPTPPNDNETFDLNTPFGVYTITAKTIVTDPTTEIRAGNSSSAAEDLAILINTSTDSRLAGYSATWGGGASTTIYGAQRNDFFDGTRVADMAGKIYIHNGSWYLPFIDSSLAGGNNDKISMYYEAVPDVNSIMNLTAQALTPSGSAGLNTIPQASYLDNYYYYDVSAGTGSVGVSVVTKSGSLAYVYNVNPTNWNITTQKQIFTGNALINTQVAQAEGYTYVIAQTATKTKVGIYNAAFTTLREVDIDDPTFSAAGNTDNIFNHAALAQYRIFAYNTEARIVGISNGLTGGGTDYRLYMARLSPVATVWTLSCGDCTDLQSRSLYVSPFVSIGVSPPLISAGATYQLGWEGVLPGVQGYRDVVSIAYAMMDDDSTPNASDPHGGLFNIKAEGIQASGLSATDNGLWRPPFIK